jgi:hypothetical protein
LVQEKYCTKEKRPVTRDEDDDDNNKIIIIIML